MSFFFCCGYYWLSRLWCTAHKRFCLEQLFRDFESFSSFTSYSSCLKCSLQRISLCTKNFNSILCFSYFSCSLWCLIFLQLTYTAATKKKSDYFPFKLPLFPSQIENVWEIVDEDLMMLSQQKNVLEQIKEIWNHRLALGSMVLCVNTI